MLEVGNISIASIREILAALDAPGLDLDDEYLDDYAAAATTIASADISALRELPDRSTTVHVMIVGTVLGDPLTAGAEKK